MSKITDMIVSAIIKRGIVYEARNVDVEFILPKSEESIEGVKIQFQAEHMMLKVEKESDSRL